MSFLNGIEHWFARVTHEIMVGGEKIVRSEKTVDKVIETGIGVASTVDPAHAIAITTIGAGVEMVWGKVCAAIHALDTAIASGEQKIDPERPVIIQIPADQNTLDSLRDAIQKMNTIRPETVPVANALLSATTPRSLHPASTAVPVPFSTIPAVVVQHPAPIHCTQQEA